MSEKRKRRTHRGRRGKRLNRIMPPGVVAMINGGEVVSAQPVPSAVVKSLRDRLRALGALEKRSA